MQDYDLTFELGRTIHHRGTAYRVEEVLENDRYSLKKIDGRKKITIKVQGSLTLDV
jgi:hypothetical protein